jgi:MFS family permease
MTSNKSSLSAVIAASSVGTMIEWYDFYIFGSLATIISTKFFPEGNPTAAFLATLATFAAGFVVRPFGALFFGRLGDLLGRKYTFMVTLLLMGGATFAIGLIPEYKTIGFAAPILVLVLRLLQGLALGGEYGGAATYVAEHAPANSRGYWTSWIQTTATGGLFISIIVIMLSKKIVGEAVFADWGWRIPFIVSILMVGVSFVIRRNMGESPVFAKVKAEGKVSANPLKESFGKKQNFKWVLLTLFGATMGQGVVWYTGQFYALTFINKVCSLNFDQTNEVMIWALVLATPFFVLFGWLSDRLGRKYIILAGMFLAVLAYRPIYQSIYKTIAIDSQKELAANISKTSSNIPGTADSLFTFSTLKTYANGASIKTEVKTTVYANGKAPKTETTKAINVDNASKWWLVFLVWIQVIFVTMVYGPIAAFLVEMFPAKIRYTSMSLPYHVGNGIFGGLMPAIATSLVNNAKEAGSSNYYLEGLWYPIIIAALCLLIGLLYLDGKDRNITD